MISSDTAKMLKRAWGRILLYADWEEPPIEAYLDPSSAPAPYPSVYCMPHVLELLANVFSVVPLALCFSKSRASLPQLASQSLECIENMDAVDRFYEIFKNEQWIFHESLPIDKVRHILADADSGKISVREASDQMADIYNEEMIEWGISELKSINNLISEKENGPFLDRTFLLWDGRDMYLSENYRGCIHLLFACVDGAVNDFYIQGESKRGLWKRAPETVVPYDTYAGHKNGLIEVLKTAKQSVSKLPIRTVEERYEATLSGQTNGETWGGMFPERHLRRNGIEHGMLTNYNNKIIAAKAWNLVFAVGDWMRSVHKAREPIDTPKSFSESIQDTLSAVASNLKYKELSESHVKLVLTPDHADFTQHHLKKRTEHFLKCWKGKKSGVQCQEMWQFGTERTLPFWWDRANDRHIKDHFAMHRIRSFQIDRISHYSYEFADVHITCHFDGYIRGERINRDISMTLKWILTDEDDTLPFESDKPDWYLMTWDPWLSAKIVN